MAIVPTGRESRNLLRRLLLGADDADVRPQWRKPGLDAGHRSGDGYREKRVVGPSTPRALGRGFARLGHAAAGSILNAFA